MSKQTTDVFFGIMEGDLFGDEPTDGIDERASIEKFANKCVKEIQAGFKKRGKKANVSWAPQAACGVIPASLQTKVNGDTDHADIEFANRIIDGVWNGWDWIVSE
jgi:hypothetical protein